MVASLEEIERSKISILEIDSGTSTCVVELDGRRTPRIEGFVLEGVWSFGLESLLALTSDCVHEESLYFYLLDRRLHQVDKVTILWPNRSGVFELQGVSENRVFFKFSFSTVWMLEVSHGTKLRFPIAGLSSGVWRPISCFSRLSAREADRARDEEPRCDRG